MFQRLRYVLFLLRKKGVRYTYNAVYFYIFWSWIRKRPLLIKLLNIVAPYPSFIEIEVTTRCNLKCVICEHTYWNEPNRDMSFEDFKRIVDQFPNLKWIGLTGIGESFLNKDFLQMLRYIKSKKVIVELYDTFFFVDKKLAEELIDLEIDKIFISLDAATKETYEKIRVGSNFDKVINNIINFIEIKKTKKAAFPEISFHFIINKYNLSEVSKFVDFVRNISQNEPVTIQFTKMLHKFKEVEELFVEVPEELIREVEEKARKLGIKILWNLDVPNEKPPIQRCIEWTMPFIFVTGHVIPCCSGNEANLREFQKKTALGNIFEKSFKEIWSGEKYKNLRKSIRKGVEPSPCRNCVLYNSGEEKK